MRTLIVTHYFPPEIGAPQARLSDLARMWTESGDEVTVLTGLPNHPTGVVHPEYRKKLRVEESVDGYRVVRAWLYATPNEGMAKKTLGHLSFMVSSVALGWRRLGGADVVVVSSPTFFSIFSAWVLARSKRARLVVEVRDLWPAIFVELGVLTNPALIRALERVELAIYHAADLVVVVTEGFRDNLIDRGVPQAKVQTIRNGVDIDRFRPAETESASARDRLGSRDGECLVLYVGAHGISHGLTVVAQAAAKLTEDPVHVTFVGEGAAKRQLAAQVAALGLDNVTMLPGVPHEEIPDLVAAADICLVPLRDVPLFSTFIPSKIFEYFGVGKAVVGAVRGEPASILRAAGAIVVEPEDAAGLADAIRELAAHPARRAEMGRRARRYVEEHFDRRTLARRYRELLQETWDGSRGGHDGAGTAAVQEFWEREACGERYGEAQDRIRYQLEPEILTFADFADARSQKVLEIGIGMGADYLRWLRAGACVVGVDLTRRAAALTAERARSEEEAPAVLVADAEHLPFKQGSFDLVYSWGVLHHTPDTERSLVEAKRILRPGGRLKLMLYHRHSWVALAAWARYCLLRGQPQRGLRSAVAAIESPGTKAFTVRELQTLLADMDAVRVRPCLTHWDRRLAPGVARALGSRFGWFLLANATRRAGCDPACAC